jgi:RND family efflux transporter MFP subunit
MSNTAQRDISALSKLAIRREQRPSGAGRAWLLFAAILVVLAAVVAGGGYWYYRTTGLNIVAALSQRPVEVSLFAVPRHEAAAPSVALVANGKIVSDRQVNVATKVSGQLVDLRFEQGDRVEQDQVLARVEDVIYRAQRDEAAANVERRKAELLRTAAELERARAALRQAEANCEFEQRNYDRLRGLRETGRASDLEVSDAKDRSLAAAAAVEMARAAITSAEAAVQMARADQSAAEATLRLLQKRLDDCDIRAPIAGVVLERNAQVGDFVAAEGGRGAQANAQLAQIADMSLLRVEIDVSERDVGRLRAGQRARVTPDADKAATYDGHVMWVDPIGNYAKATVQVKVRIENPGPECRVEGSARVEFLNPAASAPATGEKPAVWLPKAAVKLSASSDEGQVFTVLGDRAVSNAVQVGARTDNAVEILKGVYPGMQIVAENADKLADGTPVRVNAPRAP